MGTTEICTHLHTVSPHDAFPISHAALAGAGITSDAYHITAGTQEGQVRAMRKAISDAGLEALGIGHVHAHATSTPQGDLTEAASIAEAIGPHRSEEHTSELQSHMRISYAVFCLQKHKNNN